jgi:hypothetical protein
MMVGMTDDFTPDPEVLDLIQDLLPDAPWVQNAHPEGFGIRKAGARMGYNAAVYIELLPLPQPWDEKRLCGWRREVPLGVFPRFVGPVTRHPLYPFSHLGLHRFINEAALVGNYSGLGRVGLDFWDVVKTPKGNVNINGRYPDTSWVQLDLEIATSAILAPGTDGAVPTPRFEMIREGIQECEARIFIEQAITDAKSQARLDGALVERCREVLDERHRIIRAACTAGELGSSGSCPFRWCEGPPWPEMTEALYTAAADVARALGLE